MSFSRQDKRSELSDLFGRLCNEDLDAKGRNRLDEALAADVEAQQQYVRYMDLQSMIRQHAQSLDDEDFALLETQAALDMVLAGDASNGGRDDGYRSPASDWLSSDSRGGRFNIVGGAWRQWTSRHSVWAATASVLCVSFAALWQIDASELLTASSESLTTDVAAVDGPAKAITAQLRGTVGARWAGDRLELPEGEKFYPGSRLELVEGLAEIYFNSGARLILQGPAIIEASHAGRAKISVGRVAVYVPEDAEEFCIETGVATLSGAVAEYGVEVEVDGSLATEVYSGELEVQLGGVAKRGSTLKLVKNQAAVVDGQTGHAAMIPEPTGLRFVRYLPRSEMRINLAEVLAGGSGRAFHRGISLVDGQIAENYGPPAHADGKYKVTHTVDFVDGVFIPNGKLGPVQIDSIGRVFAHFPPTAGDCWGGVIMARRPRYESSLPLIQLEFFGEIYGYVNWLHIAGDSEALTPKGLGLIGMHSNCGITFDLHAMRARYPDRQIRRFRARVGNLESKAELPGDKHTAEAWVLVDGELRHHREGFSCESGPQEIDVPLSDRDRFLVLAVTDDGGNTAYDWVAFGDAVIEMDERDVISIDRTHEQQVDDVRLARMR